MNKTTKFINKLINDTKRGTLQWVAIEDNYQSIVSNEIVVLKYYNNFDGVNVNMFIMDRYTLYPNWNEIILMTCVINEQVQNKKNKMPDYVKSWIKEIINEYI